MFILSETHSENLSFQASRHSSVIALRIRVLVSPDAGQLPRARKSSSLLQRTLAIPVLRFRAVTGAAPSAGRSGRSLKAVLRLSAPDSSGR